MFVGIYRAIILPGFLRWCRISSIHSSTPKRQPVEVSVFQACQLPQTAFGMPGAASCWPGCWRQPSPVVVPLMAPRSPLRSPSPQLPARDPQVAQMIQDLHGPRSGKPTSRHTTSVQFFGLDFSHFLGLDHVGGKEKAGSLKSRHTATKRRPNGDAASNSANCPNSELRQCLYQTHSDDWHQSKKWLVAT